MSSHFFVQGVPGFPSPFCVPGFPSPSTVPGFSYPFMKIRHLAGGFNFLKRPEFCVTFVRPGVLRPPTRFRSWNLNLSHCSTWKSHASLGRRDDFGWCFTPNNRFAVRASKKINCRVIHLSNRSIWESWLTETMKLEKSFEPLIWIMLLGAGPRNCWGTTFQIRFIIGLSRTANLQEKCF